MIISRDIVTDIIRKLHLVIDVHDILRNNYISKKQCFKISLTHFLQTYFQKRRIFPQDHFTSGWPSILSNEVHEYLPGCLWYDSDGRSFQDWYRRFVKRRLLLWCTPFWPSLRQKSRITLLLLRKTIRYKLSVYHYWINNWFTWVFCFCFYKFEVAKYQPSRTSLSGIIVFFYVFFY
jgi:hypothetical protein